MSEVITGFYDNRSDANAAVDQLVAAGIARSQITLNPASRDENYERDEFTQSYDHHKDEGGFWAALKDFFFPEERRYAYSEGMSRGGTLLTVTAETYQVETVGRILDDHGSVDLEARAETWREGGWKGYDAAAAERIAGGKDAGMGAAAAPAASSFDNTARFGDVGGDKIHEHMDVIASDGVRMGTVDHMEGTDQIKLAKSTSPDGQHHFIPLDWVDHVDAHVHLKRKSPEVEAIW